MPFNPGENVGAYRIIQQLGQGGMATVHKAYHAALDRYVAIKALHPAFMEDPQFLKRFSREARVVAKLDHPNIVPIYDYAEHAGQPYLVMKFIEGETLKARLQRDRLPAQESLSLIKPVGAALSYAHERGILHRDIKPSNILISADGFVYLADFGLARIAEMGASTLSGDMLMGTPHYISPEQAKGMKELGRGTDIYSLGVVLYELFVGRVPFDSDTPFSIIHDHIYAELPLPRNINPDVPEEVQRILLKALAKDPRDRFSQVSDLIVAMEQALQGKPVEVDLTPTFKVPQDALPVVEEAPSQLPRTVIDEPAAEPRARTETAREPTGDLLRRDQKKWLWIAAGLVMSCIFLFGFFSNLNDAQNWSSPPPEGADAALRLTQDGDPAAHLRNAERFLGEGDPTGAFNEFIAAGDLFAEAGDLTAAAKAYVEAWEIAETQPLIERRKLSGRLVEVLFIGAPDEVNWPMIDRAYEREPEMDVMNLVMARRMLYSEEPEEAMRMIDSILLKSPEDTFARAVLAEHDMMYGSPEEAARIIDELLESRPSTPWLVDHLTQMKAKLER